MNSCLYECQVMHHRLQPKVHRFRYRIFLFCLDLQELERLGQTVALFSYNRPNLFAFYDRDHFDGTAGGVRGKLRDYLVTQGVTLPEGASVRLLTLTRLCGYVFNPVVFYFCHGENGAPLGAVAEVGNTFGEKKLYFIPPEEDRQRFRLVAPKHFYVSPFVDLAVQFDFKLRTPEEHLEIHVDDRRGEERLLLTALTGERRELTTWRLAWYAVKYPLVTLRVIGAIHWEAARLWLKRVPIFRKSARPEDQREVLRPHESLAGKAP